ncbi:MAG: DUF1566 domain-containing protein [Candidatus Nitrohelix vancouverensis]|uniref:DUF1566 domain-containing protein n=1 Tax=Candidatus Nitrohelix vancouverensis TaxID=2705534 RepID=A0A7T0G3M1_9BACT|nr:MAG: DUF1566 domain-containing protein [Candidatus Nitrohelix vancouverensis]
MSDEKQLIDNGNGTITDLKSNVMWKKTDSFQDTKKWMNWFRCQDYVEISNLERFGGYDDWRYPNEAEAWGLFDLGKKNTDKYGDEIYLDPIFEPLCAGTTWCLDEKGSAALIVQYEDGQKVWPSKYANFNMAVRMVRSLG